MKPMEARRALAAARELRRALMKGDLVLWSSAHERLAAAGNALMEARATLAAGCGATDWVALRTELSLLKKLVENGLEMCVAANELSHSQANCQTAGSTVLYSG